MKRTPVSLLILALFVIACGTEPTPTPDALATQISVDKAAQATMTAEVPTPKETSMPTNAPADKPTTPPTFTPADTPKPTTPPTFTPTDTPKPTVQPSQDRNTQTRSQDGMIMVYVPAGEFTMGSADNDADAWDEEKPQHTVSLDAFWIDKTEVTNAQYRQCVKAGTCTAPTSKSSYTLNGYYGNSRFGNYPVIYVNWNQARAYCQWAGARLPTEAEWEKAARGTDGREYPWGDTAPDCSRANFWGRDGGCVGDTSRVDKYPAGASPYGALNMAGNVWEWVNDWWDPEYYSRSPAANPQGPESGRAHILRGGAWGYDRGSIRAAYRLGYVASGADFYVGFHCACSVSEP